MAKTLEGDLIFKKDSSDYINGNTLVVHRLCGRSSIARCPQGQRRAFFRTDPSDAILFESWPNIHTNTTQTEALNGIMGERSGNFRVQK